MIPRYDNYDNENPVIHVQPDGEYRLTTYRISNTIPRTHGGGGCDPTAIQRCTENTPRNDPGWFYYTSLSMEIDAGDGVRAVYSLCQIEGATPSWEFPYKWALYLQIGYGDSEGIRSFTDWSSMTVATSPLMPTHASECYVWPEEAPRPPQRRITFPTWSPRDSESDTDTASSSQDSQHTSASEQGEED